MKAKLLVAVCGAALSFAMGAHAADDTAKPMPPHQHPMEKGMGGMNQGMHSAMHKGDDASGVNKENAKPADNASLAGKAHPAPNRHNHMRDHKNM